ncbi:MAG: hypothetical protein LQ349_000346 [Xanthoria aureola]|nr:MAG: hypothetical protein LQ349_000346 [Xanthoria aureola]
MLLHLLLFHLVLCINAVHALRKTEGQKVLLSNVQTLTLRHELKTSHRRVAPVPQLKCIGGNAKGYYNVDIMRCKNQGADYDREDIQWTCMASLPSEFKLGSTDVICEGYESSNDPYVLKGSCGVEYRLMLTDIGEKKYGHRVKKLVTGAIRWGGEVVQGVMEEAAMTHPLLILASLRHGAVKVSLRTQELAPLAGGQDSGQGLRRALPEATLPVTGDKLNRHRVAEDGAMEEMTTEKVAHQEGPDLQAHRALHSPRQDTRAPASGPQAGDDTASEDCKRKTDLVSANRRHRILMRYSISK